jgi:DNA mismatch endonuclease (patch repair protein)
MQGNRGADTRPELELRSELHRRGNRFRKTVAPVKGLRCRADIVFARARVAVFVDGCFWHRCPEHGTSPRTNSDYWQVKLDRNVARDRRNDDALVSSGWAVVRVWEHEDVLDAANRVEAILESRAPREHSTDARPCSHTRGQMASAPPVGRDETTMRGPDD